MKKKSSHKVKNHKAVYYTELEHSRLHFIGWVLFIVGLISTLIGFLNYVGIPIFIVGLIFIIRARMKARKKAY